MIALFSTACGAEKEMEIRSDATVENAINKKAHLVVAVDHSNEDQIEVLKELKEKFPKTGLWKGFIESFDKETDEEITYKKTVEPILKGNWKLGFAITFSKNIKSLEDLEDVDHKDVEIYIVGKFEQVDRVEKLIVNRFLKKEYGSEVKYEEKNKIKYWTVEEDHIYMMRYGDILVMTNQDKYRDDALEGLVDDKGFVVDKKLAAELDVNDSLGYIYISGKGILELAAEFYKSLGMTEIEEMIEPLGNILVTMRAEEDGFKIATVSEISDHDSPMLKNYQDFEAVLVEKVPAEGVFIYAEYPSLDAMMKNMVQSFAYSYQLDKAMIESGDEIEDLEELKKYTEESEEFYDDFMKNTAESLDIKEKELHDFFDAPHAMAMANVGELYPGISFYLEVDKKDTKIAEKLLDEMDDYVDEILKELDKLLKDSGIVEEGILKRDVAVINGGSMSKVYLDWDAVPKEVMVEFEAAAGMDLEDIDLEMYYGLTGNNVFVLALYPNFPDAYGTDVVADHEVYKEALKALPSDFEGVVSYFEMQPLFDFVETYVDLFEDLAIISDDELVIYKKVEDFATTIKYAVSGGKVDGDLLYSEVFMAVGE